MRHIDVYDYQYLEKILKNNSFYNLTHIKLYSNGLKNKIKEYVKNIFIKNWYEKNKTWNIVIATNGQK